MSFLNFSEGSSLSDSKRYKFFSDNLLKTPFIYHRKKRKLSELTTQIINNSNINKKNDEKLIFQIDHDNRMKSYNNYMKNKENEIEGRTDNYINYIRNKNNNNNDNSKIIEMNIFNLKYNSFLKKNSSDFTPYIIKERGSDITNPFYYDNIKKRILNKRRNLANNENYYKNKSHDYYRVNVNPYRRDYLDNLGQSQLKNNPIVFFNNNNNYNYNKDKFHIYHSQI